jgi:acetyl esterase
VAGSGEVLAGGARQASGGTDGDREAAGRPARRIEPFCYPGTAVAGLRFRPARTGPRPPAAIVYFHGGGWIVGSPATHVVSASHLAVATGLDPVSIRYRPAPEHPYPAKREDGVGAVRAILGSACDRAEPPERVILAGDSAGAAIAFWVETALRRDGGQKERDHPRSSSRKNSALR